MRVGLFLCYARSGGTLLNQMLGCLPEVIVLSEVSPYGGGWGQMADKSPQTPSEQLAQWYGLKIPHGSFEFELAHAIEACEKLGKLLIIRDWSFTSFTPVPQNSFCPPKRFATLDILRKLGVGIDTFALVRHPLAIWMSRGEPLSKEDFLIPYVNFAQALAELSVPIFRYEDLCTKTDLVMEQIAAIIGADGSGKEWHSFNNFSLVNGDVQDSRGIELHFGSQAKVSLRSRRARNYELYLSLHFCKEFQRAASLTNYVLPSKLKLFGMYMELAYHRSRRRLASRATGASRK